MTLAKYHAHPAISRSKLWWAHESPAAYKYFSEHPPEQTPDLLFGAALHKLVLEPQSFDVEYAILPPTLNRNSYQGKQIIEAAKIVGKEVLRAVEMENIVKMRDALMDHKTVSYFVEEGIREYSIFWTDEETQEPLKCRPDIFIANDDLHIIADIKTCASADTEDFTRACLRYGYAMQAAMYIEGVKTQYPGEYSFLFFAVEKTPPYSVNVMQMDQAFIDYGYIQFRELLTTVHKCKETGIWWGKNGAENNINKILLPSWAD